MILYPTITYFLSDDTIIFYIPDYEFVAQLSEEEFEELDEAMFSFESYLERAPTPTPFTKLEWDPEVLFDGVSIDMVDSVHFGKIAIEAEFEEEEYDNENVVGVELTASEELVRLASEHRINLSDLFEKALIERLFYG